MFFEQPLMSFTDGTTTPRPRQPNDTESVRDAVGVITQSLANIELTFSSLNEKSAELATLGPGAHDASREIQVLRKEMRDENKRAETEMQLLKRIAREDVKQKITENLRGDILEYIKQEIAAQVEQQVDLQIQEQIPISLKQQSIDNRTQLQEARTSLTNSAARKRNAHLRIQNLDEPLAPILKADGTRGKLFPADLRSLLSYSAETVRELVKEYGLIEDDVQEVNLNRFLACVGVLFQLVVV